MFRNDTQIALCCSALLSRVRLGWVFDANGPTLRGLTLLDDVKRGESPLSSGEQLMLRVALDFWNGDGNATVGEMLKILDNENVTAIGTLMSASVRGPTAVDAWLRDQGAVRRVVR